jgi:hypothetical protein
MRDGGPVIARRGFGFERCNSRMASRSKKYWDERTRKYTIS